MKSILLDENLPKLVPSEGPNEEFMVDFNSMSICLGLFYAKRLGNHVHSMFIFTFV